MRIALFGGTGYVGSYLVDALLGAGMRPVLLVRPGSETKVDRPESCDLVSGDIDDDLAVGEALRGADAVIFNIGILREFPARGITFQALHVDAVKKTIAAAQQAGVRRFLLMSANGVRAAGTPYQRTKHEAEQALSESGLDWTIFRPSVLFGDPRGRMEFATQLARDIIASPLPAPLFFPGLLPHDAGRFQLSPVHVRDVASAFIAALQRPDTIGQTLALGGPRSLTWQAILKIIATATGRHKLMVPVPAIGVSAVAAMLDRFESFPVTRDQIRMLLEGNSCGDGAFDLLDIRPVPFDVDRLHYLADGFHEGPACQKSAA